MVLVTNMEIKIPKSTAPRPITSDIKSSSGGTVSLIEETRLSPKQTKESINLIQSQDGVWHTRWGRNYYGEEISGETTLDAAFEYIKDRGKATEERHILVCGGTGTVYASTDDGDTWGTVTGATMTGGSSYSGLQIDEYFYLTNGVDALTRYDGTNLIQYSGISTPTNLALTRTTLTTGSYMMYYQVTALNEVGETVGSTEVSITVNKERDGWAGGEAVNLTWDAVTGALRYQIYWSDDSGYETLLASSTTNSYVDDNSATPNPYIITPVDDTTTAPKFRHIELSGNRIWGTGDPDNPYRVHFSGVGQYINFFSAYYGGGWIDLEYGGREVCVGVVNYRTGSGNEISTILTRTPEGTGSIWQVELDVATVEDQAFTLPNPSKIVDYIGCTSHLAIVKAGDKVFFPNINGIFDLGNKEQLYNILVSAEISQAIRPDYRALNEAALDEMCGYYFDAKIFFSAGFGTEGNDLIFIYDVERKNWNYYWDFGVKDFFESTDSSGNHHLLYVPVDGNQLVEISELFDTDFGGAFRTSFISGLFTVGDRMDAFSKVYQAIVEFGNLKGNVTVDVLGVEKNRGFSTIATKSFSGAEFSSTIDFTNTLWGDYVFSKSDDEAPSAVTDATDKKRIRINRRLNRIQYKISSNSAGTKFSILGIQANGRRLAMMPPNVWRD